MRTLAALLLACSLAHAEPLPWREGVARLARWLAEERRLPLGMPSPQGVAA